ncbi:hypothetical protein ACFWBI_08925 [Streptomyces sp. NPDC059982]
MTFTFKPSPRSRLRADRATANDRPAVWLSLFGTDGRSAAVFIPAARLEEVVAGLREQTRQSGDRATAPAHRRLTELEHTAAWHAIEGAVGEDGADPGTVLAAVLRALGIDPPAPDLTPCTPAWLASQLAGACDTVPRVNGCGNVSHYHTAEEAGA